MAGWTGPIICVQQNDLYTFGETDEHIPERAVRQVIEATGPQPLPLPSRPLNRLQLSRWLSDWERAGYVFRWRP